jgi:HTH-type transcriptional regulator/antitoxin HigA
MSTTQPEIYSLAHDDHYLQLLMNFPPRLIESEAELWATQTVIDRLLNSPELSPAERAYLNLLGMLVYDYEEKHVSIPDLQGVELLQALVEEFNLKQKDLVPIFKTESIVSAVFNGQRQFTVEHIEKLATFFHVSPALFFVTKS